MLSVHIACSLIEFLGMLKTLILHFLGRVNVEIVRLCMMVL